MVGCDGDITTDFEVVDQFSIVHIPYRRLDHSGQFFRVWEKVMRVGDSAWHSGDGKAAPVFPFSFNSQVDRPALFTTSSYSRSIYLTASHSTSPGRREVGRSTH